MKQLAVDFTKYTAVGILVTLVSVFFMWLFVDFFKINASLSSSILVVGIFFLKFMAYNKVNLIQKQVVKYMLIQCGSGFLFIIVTGILIDVKKLPTTFSSNASIASIFSLRSFSVITGPPASCSLPSQVRH